MLASFENWCLTPPALRPVDPVPMITASAVRCMFVLRQQYPTSVARNGRFALDPD